MELSKHELFLVKQEAERQNIRFKGAYYIRDGVLILEEWLLNHRKEVYTTKHNIYKNLSEYLRGLPSVQDLYYDGELKEEDWTTNTPLDKIHYAPIQAREYACKAHEEVDQTYGDNLPYSYHLDAVAELVKDYVYTYQIVAYLHDVVEDTKRSLNDVKYRYGPHITELVGLLTDEKGPNRKTRKELTNKKLSKACSVGHQEALVVKVADRLANVRYCVKVGDKKRLKMYKKEYKDFKLAVHREDLCEDFWVELDELMK